VRGAPRAASNASATVNFLTELTSASLTAIPTSRARCTPGACFSQFVTVKANAKWQLQVRLKAPPVGFTLDLSFPRLPSLGRTRLSSTTWVAVYITGPATASLRDEATFYGAKTTAPNGVVPTGTMVSQILEYRVVAIP